MAMAMAVYGAQSGKRTAPVACLLLTVVLGSVFLEIKFTEYYFNFESIWCVAHPLSMRGPLAKPAEIFLPSISYDGHACAAYDYWNRPLDVLTIRDLRGFSLS